MKKKVLFFIHDLGVGGAEKVLVNVVNNLDRTKFDITVQVLFGGGVNEQFLKDHIRLKHCYTKSFKGNSQVLKLFKPETLYRHFVTDQYDIVISYLEGVSARIVAGCKDENTKLVCWIHCCFDTSKTASVGFRNFSEAKTLFGKFDNIVCVSKWVMESFCNTMDFHKQVEVLYNTNETEQILKQSLMPIEEKIGSEKCWNICSVGKIEPVKGFDRLARIHKKLIDDGIKNRIFILGIGSQKKEIESYLLQNSLSNSFIFLGYQTNPYKYVSKCDLYVCSSLSEGFSTAVTESLIVGTPVCTVDVSGMKELLGNNNEYGVVTDNNENALYCGIKNLLEDPKLLSHYKMQAQIRGKEFSTDKTVKAVENMLLSL